jgi:hypothetical protein
MFPCIICKGDHLTHLCPLIPEINKVWPIVEGSSTPELPMVPRQPTQPLVEEVVSLMQYFVDHTPLSKSDVSTTHVLFISSLEPSEKGGIPLTSSMLPRSPQSISFYWNSLVERFLPSSTSFQIKVEAYSKTIHLCIVDEGASISIIASSAWQAIGCP